MNNEYSVAKVLLSFDSLSVFRNLLSDVVLKKLYNLLQCIASGGHSSLNITINSYNEFYLSLIAQTPSYSLKTHILERILFDENPFSRKAEFCPCNSMELTFTNAVSNDLHSLQYISELNPAFIKGCMIAAFSLNDFEEEIVKNLPEWNTVNTIESQYHFVDSGNWSDSTGALSMFYHDNGTGIFAKYTAFVWENDGKGGSLAGIECPDPITLSDLIGYTSERSEVIDNTLKFLNGFPSNNILLYGDRGTGKSSTVKAIVNEYSCRGLRIIEVPKKALIDFPLIIRSLRNRNQKFIIFVDDLAFEDNEENYTALKAALEGSLESKPGNVVIYATSNRRHLIKEKFSDRLGLMSDNPDDEIRAADSIHEKLSLADRFGITVIFSSPDKQKYLEIVEGIAANRGLKIDKEQLDKEAMKWELWYNGRSPRTARQFVDWLEGETRSKG